LNRRAVRVRIREHERRNLDAARLRHPVRGCRRRARCRRSPGWARHCGTTTPRRPPGERGRPQGVVRSLASPRPKRERLQPTGRFARFRLCRADALRGGRTRDVPLSLTGTAFRRPRRPPGGAWEGLQLAGRCQRRAGVHLREPDSHRRSGRAGRGGGLGSTLRAPFPPCAPARHFPPFGASRPRGRRGGLRLVAGRRRARGVPEELPALLAAGRLRSLGAPPGFQPALQPFWGQNRCFAIADGAAVPPAIIPRIRRSRARPFGVRRWRCTTP
jgi:hypothetical protein